MSDGPNPYAPPKVSLEAQPEAPRGPSPYIEGTLEGALRGEFELPPLEIFKEARALTKGAMGAIWLAALFLIAVFAFVLFITNYLTEGNQAITNAVSSAVGILLSPVTAGLLMMGVRRSVGATLNAGQVTAYFDRAGTLVLASLVVTLVSGLPSYVLDLDASPALGVLLLPYNIVVTVCTLFWVPLVIDREMGAFEALSTSARVGLRSFVRVFIFLFVVGLITVGFTLITLGIGVIWLVPWTLLMSGIAYRRAFGVALVRE